MSKRLKRLEARLEQQSAKLRNEVEAEVGPVVELPSTGGTLRLATPSDAIYFDQGYSWPAEPHKCAPSCDHAVITHVDQERGTITFASSPPKVIAPNSLVRPMNGSEARYLGLLYLEAQGWI